MIGKEVVDHGFIWRIGNGNFVSVWKDNWISNPPDYKVAQPYVPHTPFLMSNLIDQDTGQWDQVKLDSFF